MWRWKGDSTASEQNSTSVIDQSCEMEGRFRFSGTLIINGKFRGELLSPDTLLVGETAELEADVRVGTVIVNGSVNGNITARERVELRAGARIAGGIVTPALVLEEGVVFDGRCSMIGDEIAAAQKIS
jgi:cytoskeletal protein CcmA (bactofilin family)